MAGKFTVAVSNEKGYEGILAAPFNAGGKLDFISKNGIATDTEVNKTKTELTADIATAKGEAISAAATDATSKAGKALEDANTYTDSEITKLDIGAYAKTSEVTAAISTSEETIQGKLDDKVETSVYEAKVTELADDIADAESNARAYTDVEVKKVADELDAVKTFSVKVVKKLPETGEEKVIYLVPATNTENNNVSDEYLYIKDEDTDTYKWEQIGTTAINLAKELKPIYTELEELENMMPEIEPNLSASNDPSISFTSNKTIDQVYYVGDSVDFGTLTTTFNSGKIDPKGQSDSSFRCGKLTSVKYTGSNLNKYEESNIPNDVQQTYTFTNDLTGNYTVSSTDTSTWTVSVSYSKGAQPKTNKNNDYGEPLPAGTKSKSISITGTYPWYAVTSKVDTWTEQPKQKINNSYYEVKFITVGSGKHQKVAFDNTFSEIKAIAALNTFSGNWEWASGNAATSINAFTKTTETIESRTCNVYTRKEDNTGEASYRFCTNTNKSNLNK